MAGSATYQGTQRPRLALAVLSAVLFVTFLDNTIVAAALANIQTDLRVGVSALQWIVSAYALAFAALMLTFGTLSDHLGRRRVMTAGLVVFTVGSLIGAVATSSGLLIAARVVMGVGAAASEPGTLSMIRQLYLDPGERDQALGVWAAIAGLALALGPVIGGALVGVWSWRAIFVFNIAIGVLAVAGVRLVLPEPPVLQRRRLDVAGFLLGAGAVTAATFAVISGETSGYRTWWVAGLFALAAVSVGVFVVVERRAEEPVLDVRFFRDGSFTAGNTLAFTGYFATFSVFFFVPLFVQILGTATGYDIAVDFLPMAAVMIAASALSGRWIGRHGPRVPMALGCAVAGAAILATDSLISPSSGPTLFAWSLALVGAGLGVVMVAATSSVLAAVPVARSGMAASSVNTSRELGAVAGVSVLGAIVDGQLTHTLVHRLASLPCVQGICPETYKSLIISAVTTGTVGTQESTLPKTGPIADIVNEVLGAANSTFSHGLDLTMLIAAALLFASAVLSAVIVPRHRGPSSGDEELLG